MKSKIAKLGITFALVCTMCSGVLVTSNVGNAFEVSGNEVQAANVSAVQAAAQTVSANSSNASAQEAESVATSSNSSGEAEYATDHILVVFDDAQDGQNHVQAMQAKSLLQQQGFNVTKTISEASEQSGSIAKVDVPDNTSIDAAVEQAKATNGVSHAQPDYIYRLLENNSAQASASNTVLQNTTKAQTIPNDPATQIYDPTADVNQYYVYGTVYNEGAVLTKGANVLDAWDVVKCNNNTTVAVFDTGANLLHEDLQGTLLKDYAYDTYNNQKLEASGTFNGDYAGHGSHVCGIVGAVANNGVGLAGASYNANVLPIKVFNNASSTPGALDSDIVQAYEYVFDLMDEGSVTNLHVINMSLGGYGSLSSEDRAVETKIKEAKTRNIITVCAGGNGSSSGTPYTKNQYPSDFDDAFAVTALDTNGTNAVWSDYNMQKNISAPGVKIYSSVNTSSSSYARYSGTSMASPLVAGIAALLWSANSEATVDDVWSAITSTADAIDDPTDAYSRWPDKTGSAGAINALEAVKKISGAYITTPTDFKSLLRTESVQLSANILNVDEALEWQWSVENGTGSATITQDGLVTGVSAGSVTVTATTNYNDREYSAQISLTIDDIALNSTPSVTKGYSDAITVSWVGVEGANSYKVQRSSQGSAGFETITTLSGSKGENLSYADTTAESSKVYTYRIVPVGTLDGKTIEGKASDAVSGVRFDMTISYASQEAMAEALKAHMAIDNKSVDTVIVVAEGDTTSLITASGLAGTYNAPIVTVASGATALTPDAVQALNKLTPLRIVVVGSETSITTNVTDDISRNSPFATIVRYSETVPNKLSEQLYRLGSSNSSWGSTAFIISSSSEQAKAASSLVSYAYAAKAPVFTTTESGDVSVTTRQNLIAGAFKRIVIIGDETAVSAAAESKLNSYGITTERISGNNVYSLSASIATDGLNQHVFTGTGFGFVQSSTSTAAQAAALAGYTSMPLLVVSDTNEDATKAIPSIASAQANSAQSTANSRVVSFFDGSNAISSTEKERLQKIVDGESVEPLTQPSVKRLAGTDQVQTSAAISTEGFETSENVVVARSDDFMDAMSATGLAGALNAPILLTDRQQLSVDAKTEIERLGAKNVYIIGGSGAILQEVEEALKNDTKGIENVQRVYGDAAYDTAVECAKKILEVDSKATTRAIVASSYTFEDALSISSFAYKYHVPIFLQTFGDSASDRSVPEAAVSMLTGEGALASATVYVPGGPGAVSNESLAGLSREGDTLIRMYEGEDAYGTSIAIAKRMLSDGLLSASTVTFASGAKAPGGVDALAGSALAGLKGGVLLLVNDVAGYGDVNTNALTDVLKPNVESVQTAYILGGTSVMPDSFLNKVKEVMGL